MPLSSYESYLPIDLQSKFLIVKIGSHLHHDSPLRDARPGLQPCSPMSAGWMHPFGERHCRAWASFGMGRLRIKLNARIVALTKQLR